MANFYTKMLVDHCVSEGIQVYQGSSKKPSDRAPNWYPPRSHDCMPAETKFANAFEEAQQDLERREKNRRYKRTMKMWRYSIDNI